MLMSLAVGPDVAVSEARVLGFGQVVSHIRRALEGGLPCDPGFVFRFIGRQPAPLVVRVDVSLDHFSVLCLVVCDLAPRYRVLLAITAISPPGRRHRLVSLEHGPAWE